MEIAVIIVSILLIAIVLLQSGKAESANIIQGGSSELFQNRKERGRKGSVQNQPSQFSPQKVEIPTCSP